MINSYLNPALIHLVMQQFSPSPLKILAIALAAHADFSGRNIHSSRNTLAQVTGVSIRTVARQLVQLKELGFIEVENKPKKLNVNTDRINPQWILEAHIKDVRSGDDNER